MCGFTRSIVVRIAIILFSVFCIFTVIRIQFKINDVKSQTDDKTTQLEEAEGKLEQLEQEVEEAFDREYIIKVAKEKLGLRLPQEIIFYNGD